MLNFNLLYSLDIYDEINNYRNSIGLNELKLSQNLIESSEKHLDYLIKQSKISHKGEMNSMVSNRALSSGATALNYGEIIGYSYSKDVLFTEWLNSKTHRDVIRNENYNWIGISIKKVGESYVSVINFSTGLLGSTKIEYKDGFYLITGLFINNPTFIGNFEVIDLSKDDDRFKLYIKPLENNFFIYVYDKNKKLTDRVDIFLNNY